MASTTIDNFVFLRRVKEKSYEQISREYAAGVFVGDGFLNWAGPFVPYCEFDDLVKMWETHKK